MKVKVDSVSPTQKKLIISVPQERFSTEVEDVFRRVGSKAKIPGFRPGKIPRPILEQRFRASIEAEVYETLIKQTISEAIQKENLQAIRISEVSEPDRKKEGGFSFHASVEVKPEIDVKDYSGVKIEGSRVEVTQEHIQKTLQRLQESQAILKDREGALEPQKGDFVSLEIQSPSSKEKPKEQVYELGGGILLPEMEEAVFKLKVGESTSLTIKDPHKKKDITLQITLKSIKERILPELNDDFAKSLGAFETFSALKDRVEKDLQEEAEHKAKSENLGKIMEALLKKNPVELPPTLVNQELLALAQDVQQQMTRAGIEKLPEDYPKEKLQEDLKNRATRRVHEQILLEAIAKKENISVEKKEVNDRIQAISKAAKVPPAELQSYYEKTGRIETLELEVLSQKTLDFLLEKAIIK